MVFMFPSCSDEGTTEPPVGGNPGLVITNDSILIVYFSHSRNTAIMAGYIQEYTGAATFEIVPTVPYPEDYNETVAIADRERRNDDRPLFYGQVENWDRYSVVMIGSPIWYYEPPMIIHTFYETYRAELAGKILVPFCTHAGSGAGSCTILAREYFPNATILEALGVSGSNVQSESARRDVENWLARMGISRYE